MSSDCESEGSFEYESSPERNPDFSIDAFAEKWNGLYHLLDKFGFREQHESGKATSTYSHLSYPPHQNLSPLLEDMDLNPLARELISKLVFPVLEEDVYLAPDIHAVTYIDGPQNSIKSLRNASLHHCHLFASEVEAADLSRHEIILTDGWFDGPGRMLVLNVVTGIMLDIPTDEMAADNGSEAYFSETSHDAMELLDDWYSKYQNLQWIPIESQMREDSIIYSREEKVYDDLKARLLKEYGWPDKFKRAAWIANRRELHSAASE